MEFLFLPAKQVASKTSTKELTGLLSSTYAERWAHSPWRVLIDISPFSHQSKSQKEAEIGFRYSSSFFNTLGVQTSVMGILMPSTKILNWNAKKTINKHHHQCGMVVKIMWHCMRQLESASVNNYEHCLVGRWEKEWSSTKKYKPHLKVYKIKAANHWKPRRRNNAISTREKSISVVRDSEARRKWQFLKTYRKLSTSNAIFTENIFHNGSRKLTEFAKESHGRIAKGLTKEKNLNIRIQSIENIVCQYSKLWLTFLFSK